MLEALVITWFTKFTSSEVTSLLRKNVSCAVALSTHGRISSIAVCAIGYWIHSFTAKQLSAVALPKHKGISSTLNAKFHMQASHKSCILWSKLVISDNFRLRRKLKFQKEKYARTTIKDSRLSKKRKRRTEPESSGG